MSVREISFEETLIELETRAQTDSEQERTRKKVVIDDNDELEIEEKYQDQDDRSILEIGFGIARGNVGNASAVAKWMRSLRPNLTAIQKGIDNVVAVEDGINIPIGLTVVTGSTGSGKTTWVKKGVAPAVPDDMDGVFLKFGEPGYFIPYLYPILLRMLEHSIMESVEANKSGIMIIDSLMGVWFDPFITKGFPYGKGGASLGVPVLLQTLGQFALAQGYRVVAVVHPVFSDPEVMSKGISGVSSLFLDKDSGSYIVRDYQRPADDDINIAALQYTRKEHNIGGDTLSNLKLLTQTMGDEA